MVKKKNWLAGHKSWIYPVSGEAGVTFKTGSEFTGSQGSHALLYSDHVWMMNVKLMSIWKWRKFEAQRW